MTSKEKITNLIKNATDEEINIIYDTIISFLIERREDHKEHPSPVRTIPE